MSSNENQQRTDSTMIGVNILMFFCWTWGTAIEVFLHKNFGSRYLGLQALAVFILVPFYGAGFKQHDLTALVLFLPAYLLMIIVARIGVLRRWWRGEYCHSMYSGWPRLLSLKDEMTELKCKRVVEPILAFAIGFIVLSLGELPLGSFIMGGSICMGLTVNIDLQVREMQVQRLNDSVIEQQRLAERFRELRGSH